MLTQRTYLVLLLIFSLFYSCAQQKKDTTLPIDNTATLDEMIGQMIMIGFRGMDYHRVSDTIKDQIRTGQVGGIILFDYDIASGKAVRNIAGPIQVKRLIDSLQLIAPTPLLVAVDQEGGRVNRLKPRYGFPKSVSAKYLGELDDLDSTRHYAAINANTLKQLGFNVNFAPVVDVDLNPDNPVIGGYERSYSDKTDVVIKHASAWIKLHDAQKIISTLKHFPGHGSSAADSHAGFTDVSNLWQKEELIPFKKISEMDYAIAIMTAHIFNHHLDSIFPATLSDKVIKGIVRDQWQFDGLLFSDDLQMGAVNALFDFETIIKQSILAGVDILVFGNNLKYDEIIPQKAATTIKKLIKQGDLSEDQIKKSYERIMRQKSIFN